MATCGRHTLAERSLRFFLDQEHDPERETRDVFNLLIFNNSDVPLRMDPDAMKDVEGYKSVQLINQDVDRSTLERYKTLGAIYNDMRWDIEETDVIVHWDDDDIFLPNHLYEGMRGYRRAMEQGKLAYKPAKSWYRHAHGIELMSNTLEPSIFVDYHHIIQFGYRDSTSDQHLKWVDPLVYEGKILVDANGAPTLIYNWGDTDIPTFKTSGNHGHPNNFNNYRSFSNDHGDRILTPWEKKEVQKYYDLVYAKAAG